MLKKCGFKNPRKGQRGVAALLFSVIVLLLITLVTLYTSGPLRTEQQITANDYRSSQALNAAEAGLYYFLGVLRQQVAQEQDPLVSLLEPSGLLDPTDCSHELTIGGVTRSFQFGEIAMLTRELAPVLVDGTADVRTCNDWHSSEIPPEAVYVQLDVTGRSDDLIGQRELRHLVQVRAWETFPTPDGAGAPGGGPNPPNAPLVARGEISLGGTYEIDGKDGQAVPDGKKLRSGHPDKPDVFGASTKEIDADSQSVWGASAGELNDWYEAGDAGKDEMFLSFFGASKEEIKAQAFFVPGSSGGNTQINAGTVADAKADGKNIIWVEGSGNNKTIQITSSGGLPMGTDGEPIILIVDGEVRTQGNQEVHGMIYSMTGGFGAGTIDVYGSVVSEEGYDGRGTMNIYYDFDALDRMTEELQENVLRVSGDAFVGLGGLIPGAWRDWRVAP